METSLSVFQYGIRAYSDAPWASNPSSPSPLHLPIMIPSTLTPINIKLDRSNYMFWKSHILPAARAHDLEAFLLGTKLKPSEHIADPSAPFATVVNPEYATYLDQA